MKDLRHIEIRLPTKPDVIIRSLWFLDIGILVISGLILAIGLFTLFFGSDGSSRAVASGMGRNRHVEKSGAKEGDQASESLLVKLAKAYSDHLHPKVVKNPDLPKPPKNPNPPKPSPENTPPPPPPPPPPPQVPKPSFNLISTIVVGKDEGLAWILIPGQQTPKAFSVGEMVEKYKLERLENGRITVSQEGSEFTLEVPQPQRETVSAPSALPKAPPAAGHFRKPPAAKAGEHEPSIPRIPRRPIRRSVRPSRR